MPEEKEQWDRIASDFEMLWNFPQCCGAIDGKHIAVKQPPRSGTSFYNYKGFYSIVLFAMVDADYNFIYFDIGRNGSANDAQIFNNSSLASMLQHRRNNFPEDHVVVGDSIFALKPYLMKPYGSRSRSAKQTIFNYRLSRARRIVENAFGILTLRFRVFTKPIESKTNTVDDVVLAACTLHNWLRASVPGYFTTGLVDEEETHTGEIIPGQWRKEVGQLPAVNLNLSNNYSKDAKSVRNDYAHYFWRRGAIPGQWRATGIDPIFARCIPEENELCDDDDPFQVNTFFMDNDTNSEE